MMGRQDRDQGQLFYEFNLDDVVPKDHLLRERFRRRHARRPAEAFLQRHWPPVGRSGTHDPDAHCRLLYGIRHERRLCEEVKANKRVQFGYGLNYLIDIENAAIVDVEATPARTYDEVAATQTMLDRTEKRFDLKPKRLAADTAYGDGQVPRLAGQGEENRPPHSGLREE
jgi:hypothetical protein